MAQFLRFMAIMFAAFGGLTPFIVASGLLSKNNSWAWTQIGYISLGLAAACVGLDKFFGYSSSWIRFIMTSLALQKHLDWAPLNSKVVGDQFNSNAFENMVRRVQTFNLQVLSELEKEASDWAAEYRSNLAEMEKAARQQLETLRPGSISLRIINADKTKEGVSVSMDGIIQQITKQADCFLSPVYPGDHYIQVKGEIDGKVVSAAGNARVEPGRSISLELILSVSGDS
jgi:hypothetical protein